MSDTKDNYIPDLIPDMGETPIKCSLRPLEDSDFALFMELVAELTKRFYANGRPLPKPSELDEKSITEYYRMYLEFFKEMPPEI